MSFTLRPDQVQDLSWHIANPRGLMRHEPGVGKTPIACMLAWYVWSEEAKHSAWVQPKSLLNKNRKELLRFSEFRTSDVAILDTDHAPLRPSWTGPTMTRIKKTRSRVVKVIETGDQVTACYLQKAGVMIFTAEPDGTFKVVGSPKKLPALPPGAVLVELLSFYTNKGKLKPLFEEFEEPVEVADLIAASADVKVILCGFRFWSLHWERILAAHPDLDLMLVDESHFAYGSNDSQNTLALYASMRKITRFVPMTATLINGQLSTAFPIIHLIEPLYYGSYDGFLGQHAGYIDKYNRVTDWVNTDKINTILKRHSTYRSFEDAYGKEAVVVLPPQEVDMSPEVRAAYDQFHELSMLELANERVLDGSLPGVSTIRARQIMAHPESLGLGGDEPTGKDTQLLMDLHNAGPSVVFSVHVAEQERLVRLLTENGRRVGLINGNVSAAKRSKVDEDFSAGRIDTIVASPATAAVGWNWAVAQQIVFVSLSYTDTDFRQAYGRGLRGKRTTNLLVRTYLYADSVDQRVLKLVLDKARLAARADESRKTIEFSEAA